MPGRRSRIVLVAGAAAVATAVILLRAGSGGPALPRAGRGSPASPLIRAFCEADDFERPCRFDPARLSIRVGQSVRWVNGGDVFHTVTSTRSIDRREPSGLFDRSLVTRGDSFAFRFGAPGVYNFYCRPHSEFMFGTVEVRG